MEELSKITNTKSLMKTPVPNYKTVASFHIKLHEDEQYISSRDRLTIDQNLFDHLIENKEDERVRKQRDKFDNTDIKSLEEIQSIFTELVNQKDHILNSKEGKKWVVE